MDATRIDNVNVISQEVLPPPVVVKERLPLTDKAAQTVLAGRQILQKILDRQDHRVFLVVGPCSIHNPDEALDYAERIKAFSSEVSDTLYLVMRVYFEKPRTTTGWKGLINDPDMDDTFHIEKGVYKARKLLLDLAEMGIPTATEALDPIMPQYLHDLISWTAIGARTTESQTHREMASGLSTPVGFKNGTDGSLKTAINALMSVSRPHSFLGINQKGQCAIIRTRGNPYAHMVLRGGDKPNYDSITISHCEKELAKSNLAANIVVDCSHANSNKDPAQQPLVLEDCNRQISNGNRSIIGFMVESNLNWGSQPIPADLKDLKPGVSVTDACIDWAMTQTMLRSARNELKDVLPSRISSGKVA